MGSGSPTEVSESHGRAISRRSVAVSDLSGRPRCRCASHRWPNVWAAILGPLARTPVVIAHEHTWSFEGQRLRKLLDRRLIGRRVDTILAVSRPEVTAAGSGLRRSSRNWSAATTTCTSSARCRPTREA